MAAAVMITIIVVTDLMQCTDVTSSKGKQKGRRKERQQGIAHPGYTLGLRSVYGRSTLGLSQGSVRSSLCLQHAATEPPLARGPGAEGTRVHVKPMHMSRQRKSYASLVPLMRRAFLAYTFGAFGTHSNDAATRTRSQRE